MQTDIFSLKMDKVHVKHRVTNNADAPYSWLLYTPPPVVGTLLKGRTYDDSKRAKLLMLYNNCCT